MIYNIEIISIQSISLLFSLSIFEIVSIFIILVYKFNNILLIISFLRFLDLEFSD